MTIHGIIPVMKEKGYTSHDVVAKLRRIMKQKKIGHTGTLDPSVEGVLPICMGQATRVAEYVLELPKRYRGSMVIGVSTDTQDQSGVITETKAVTHLSQAQVDEVFTQFHGQIDQLPPMFSAVKVNGKRLYEMARQGKEVERKSRIVQIYELTCLKFEHKGATAEIHFDVQCSKGTYIRTLCVDIGKALGYPAHMNHLVRTESGPFRIDDCYTLAEIEAWIEKEASPNKMIHGLDTVLGHLPALILPDTEVVRVFDGCSIELTPDQPPFIENQLLRVYSEAGRFCALYRVQNPNMAKPEKVFRDVES
ncbi:tRNA pseudouridine(55) synthase TruB [Hazenella sp. IB182353]|uniref:tRNA pseudouridine(55) synthase TruB n=1 Tax=Polycladospora coralii TaxID=2771432 RepID=UPI0017472ED4|nr:tRNA pseudouridine(55) synthase TruB [Polycladospora coralii]